MTGWLRESCNARSILMVLFALVLAIRVAIPTGYMPTRAADGIVITVCTGMGQAKVFLPIEREGEADRQAPAEQPCTVAVGIGDGVLAPLSLMPVFLSLPRHGEPASRKISDLTVHRLAAPPPPSHGPPADA